MSIRTEKHIGPNGPEWTAVDDDSYDGPGSPMGWGATELQAVMDLQEQMSREAHRRYYE